MRIHYFHSTNVLVPSANAVQTMHMCEALAREGAAVELFFPGYVTGNTVATAESYAYYGVANLFQLRRLRAPFTHTLIALPGYLTAAKLLGYSIEAAGEAARPRTGRCDVIYTRCAAAALAMPVLGRLRRPRPLVVFEAHEYPRDAARARGLRHVDAIVAITHATADELTHTLKFPAERILVAPDGVPDGWLQPIDKDDARQQLGIHAGRPLVVYTGRLHRDTVPLLLAAAERLRDCADLVLVGAPPDESGNGSRTLTELRELSLARGLSAQFTGPVRADQARLYQAAADILIAPYSGTLRWARYMSPLKIFEYMASGRPIVASDLPVLHEVLRHGETTWFVPAADGAAIAEGVRTLLSRPDAAARIGQRARAEAPHYAWSGRARAVLAFVEARRRADGAVA